MLFADRAARAKTQWEQERPDLAGDLATVVVVGRLFELGPIILNRFLAPELNKIGLKQGEFDVLATLTRAGPPYKLTPTELYKATMTSSGGMTARLDKLEKAGLIERCPHPDDRRALTVCLTGKAHQLVTGALPDIIAAQRQALSCLTPQEQEQLSSLLGKLIGSVGDPSP
ncbi:MarR family transcriptional regulator [Roseibium sp. RKSG952]|nr:MarR family transcriptional regulator [Roseibium sp. RKSG952]